MGTSPSDTGQTGVVGPRPAATRSDRRPGSDPLTW